MANIFCHLGVNRLFLYTILFSFTFTYAVPVNAIAPPINEVIFMTHLQKAVDKLANSKGKGVDKIISCLVDIKEEIEYSCNTKLDIDKYIDQVGIEIKKNGQKSPTKQLAFIKKKIKQQQHKNKSLLLYLSDTMYLEGYQLNGLDEQMYIAKHKKNDSSEEEKVEVPALLVYGVTMTLCGLFLMVLPIPVCKLWGEKILAAGVTACANSLCTIEDKKKKE